MIGRRLTQLLTDRGYEVIIMSRESPGGKPASKGVSYANWNIAAQSIDADAVRKSDHIIHLAGAGVADKRWSEKRKQEIVNSRTQSNALIIKALQEIPNQVQTVVSASAIGWYGPDTVDSRNNGFKEDAPPDRAFLGETCRQWEDSIALVAQLGKRLVKLRTGIVLGKGGGALAEFKKPLKAGIAAILGNGKQVISWIQVDDLCRMYVEAIENMNLKGAYNAVAPNPVTNEQLTNALAKQMHGKWYLNVHVPSLVLKMVLGEMSVEVLKSATVNSNKMELTGFKFLYPTIEAALAVS